MGSRGCPRAQCRQQPVADPRREPIAERDRVSRPRRDGVAPEHPVAVDFDGFHRDAQFGLVHREMPDHDPADAQLPARLLGLPHRRRIFATTPWAERRVTVSS